MPSDSTSPLELATREALANAAFTFASDIVPERDASPLARRFLRTIARSGLRHEFQGPLLRRLALNEWVRVDRPKPMRARREGASREADALLFFREHWRVDYEDIAVALGTTEEQSRNIVHKARLDRIYSQKGLHGPSADCRPHRERLSALWEGHLKEPEKNDVNGHLRSCRACAAVDFNLQAMVSHPGLPLTQAPPAVTASGRVSRGVGVAFGLFGLVLGLAEQNADFRAATQRRVDRVISAASRGRTWMEQRFEDVRILTGLVGGFAGDREAVPEAIDKFLKSREMNKKDPGSQNNPTPSPVDESEGNKSK